VIGKRGGNFIEKKEHQVKDFRRHSLLERPVKSEPIWGDRWWKKERDTPEGSDQNWVVKRRSYRKIWPPMQDGWGGDGRQEKN